MRKYLIGILIGFLLSIPFSAYGKESSSLVGKTVQAEHKVVVNGKELEVNAVNIGGTTFSPNRAIAEELGMRIEFVNQKVVFESIVFSNQEGDVQLDVSKDELISRIGKLRTEILFLYNDLSKIDIEYRGKEITEEVLEEVEKINQKIAELESEKKTLEAQLELLE